MTRTTRVLAAAVCAAVLLPTVALANGNDCSAVSMNSDWYLQTMLDGKQAFCYVELDKRGNIEDGLCLTVLKAVVW